MRLATVFTCAALIGSTAGASADTRSNMADAIAGIEAATGTAAAATGPELCFRDNACNAFVSNVQVSALGFGVELFVTSQDPVDFYMSACAGALAGLASTDSESAAAYVMQGFGEASRTGDARYDIAGVEMRLRATSDSRIGCEFVRR